MIFRQKDAGAIPGKREEYETWLGIKYFWGPDGPLQLGFYPHSIAQGSAAAAMARQLKQSHIGTYRAAIERQISKIFVDN
jgi:hypothetical protein